MKQTFVLLHNVLRLRLNKNFRRYSLPRSVEMSFMNERNFQTLKKFADDLRKQEKEQRVTEKKLHHHFETAKKATKTS